MQYSKITLRAVVPVIVRWGRVGAEGEWWRVSTFKCRVCVRIDYTTIESGREKIK